MTIVSDASLAPGGGRSHEGVTIYHGPTPMSWKCGKQSLIALSSCEVECVGMVAGIQHSIHLILSLGDITQQLPIAQ
eukprot:8784606-Prorocentrum_lima.AAC.1